MSDLIARVMSRVVEVGDCLEWKGGYMVRVPAIVFQGKNMNVRRALALDAKLLDGKNADKVAVVRCLNWRCVRPEHIQVLSRKKLQQRTADLGHFSAKTVGARKKSASARKRAKLSVEIAAEIRASTDTQRELAKRYGVSQSLVYAIRKGLVWREYNTAFGHLVRAVT